MKLQGILIAALLLAGQAGLALAQETQVYKMTLSDHRFDPAEVTIPANTRVRLEVHNKDNNFEEFHSDALKTEKIIGPFKRGIIMIGPLPPGVYEFMGEFHAETAQGQIIVK